MSLAQAIGYSRMHRGRFLDELTEFIRFPSISVNPRHADDVARCAAWLANRLQRIGLEHVKVIPTQGHPIVHAEWRHAAGRPTVLVYGHYDVQPVDPLGDWESPPFEPTIRGDNIFARGATDDKGPLFAHVKAMESYLATGGALPVNVVCLFEGEEEIGSANLLQFLARNRSTIKADVALISDTAIPAPNQPAIIHALRGALSLELEVSGPRHDLHSGKFGGVVHNPIQVLCEIIAKLHDRTGRVAIPGFYGRVNSISAAERAYMAQVAPTDGKMLQNSGSDIGWGENGYTLYERSTIRPALTINGITGGYQGVGGKSVIPANASAKISFRLVPDQEPSEIKQLFRRHIARITPPTVKISIRAGTGARPVVIDPAHPVFAAAEAAYVKGFRTRPVFLRSGGSIPAVSAFQEAVGIPAVLMGFSLSNDKEHGPNEKFHLPNFYNGIATSLHFLDEIGRMRARN